VGTLIDTIATKEDVFNLRKDLTAINSNLIKWRFVFWLANMGATLAILLLILKK